MTSIDRAWLNPASNTFLWVDLAAPSIPELLILSDTFAFHPLSIEDARAELHYPKIEAYDGYLYAILHGIAFQSDESEFATQDVDFFIGPTYLVTVHNGTSRSIAALDGDGRTLLRVSTGFERTDGGKSHSWDTPTSARSKPRAQTISVAAGKRLATRGVPGSLVVSKAGLPRAG